MHKFLFFLLILSLNIIGCSRTPPQKNLTRDILLKLDASCVNEIVISVAGKGELRYLYEFPVRDPEKIDIILRCMKTAKQIADAQRLHRTATPIAFKTQRMSYCAGIGWDNNVVYGDWEDEKAVYHGRWESAELREYFRQWNLIEEIAAADPNLPPPTWMTNPPKIEPMPPMPDQESKDE